MFFIYLKRDEKFLDIKISLGNVADVKSFVNSVSKFGCEVDLVSGRYIVDGRSIMGIFSLDLSKPINANIRACADEKSFLTEIERLIAE